MPRALHQAWMAQRSDPTARTFRATTSDRIITHESWVATRSEEDCGTRKLRYMPTQVEIAEHGRALANEIREWCRSQASAWQRLPYLSLVADGANGLHGRYHHCYEFGLWPVSARGEGRFLRQICVVDCETGELCRPETWYRRRRLELARDMDILELAGRLRDVDAGFLVLRMQDEASNGTGQSDAWLHLLQRTGLRPDAPFNRALRPTPTSSPPSSDPETSATQTRLGAPAGKGGLG